MSKTTLNLRYFASLRETAGKASESWETSAKTARELYLELKEVYGFRLEEKHLKVSKNRHYVDFDAALSNGDEIVFIPPVSGG